MELQELLYLWHKGEEATKEKRKVSLIDSGDQIYYSKLQFADFVTWLEKEIKDNSI